MSNLKEKQELLTAIEDYKYFKYVIDKMEVFDDIVKKASHIYGFEHVKEKIDELGVIGFQEYLKKLILHDIYQ